MPALRIFGDEPLRGPGEGLLFDRLPITARQDDRLSPSARLQLAAIVPKGGPWPEWVEISDDRLQEETGQCRSSIQSNWKQLEEAGWVMRSRRRGRRKIFLLFDLAGNARRARDSGHACTESRASAPRFLRIHAQDSGQQDLRGREAKILKGGSPSATSPGDGGSPSTTPAKLPEKDPADVSLWTEAEADQWRAIRDQPGQPFARQAARLVAAYERSRAGEQGGGKAGSSPPTKDLPDPAPRTGP